MSRCQGDIIFEMPPNYAVFCLCTKADVTRVAFFVNAAARHFTTRSQVAAAFLPDVASRSQFVVAGRGKRTKIAILLGPTRR
jgi:hypothetical protein